MSAAATVALLRDRGVTLGVAESLTGGALAAALVSVPGASVVLRGGIVAYATDLKASLLGVDPDLLAARGPVDADVAMAMADGARRVLGADLGLATTGVAGPDTQHDHKLGTIFVGIARADWRSSRALRLTGHRDQLRAAAVGCALALLRGQLEGEHGQRTGGFAVGNK